MVYLSYHRPDDIGPTGYTSFISVTNIFLLVCLVSSVMKSPATSNKFFKNSLKIPMNFKIQKKYIFNQCHDTVIKISLDLHKL